MAPRFLVENVFDYLIQLKQRINPQHTIPTIVDNGFALWESRAIAIYLAEKYAKDDTLYPKDVKQRALVNQRMYFDMGTLYTSFAEYYYPIFFKTGSPDPEKYKKMEANFDLLNKFLEGQDFLVGKNMTVADLSIVASVSTFEAVRFDISKYPNVAKWYEKVKITAPGYEEVNAKNLAQLKQFLDDLQIK